MFEPSSCNGCYDVLMMPVDINSVVILNINLLIIVVLSPELAKVKPSFIMNKKTEMFGDNKIEKCKFHPNFLVNVDI